MDLKPKEFSPVASENKTPFLFYGTLFVGSELTSVNFIFDTTSEYSWIPTTDCIQSKCASVDSNYRNNIYDSTRTTQNLYDYDSSSTYT